MTKSRTKQVFLDGSLPGASAKEPLNFRQGWYEENVGIWSGQLLVLRDIDLWRDKYDSSYDLGSR